MHQKNIRKKMKTRKRYRCHILQKTNEQTTKKLSGRKIERQGKTEEKKASEPAKPVQNNKEQKLKMI